MTEILYTIVIYPITQILEFTFFLSQKIFRENGISIVAIGLIISTLTLPLYAEAEKWQEVERQTQKKLKPRIDKIKKTFKGDQQYMTLATYYRQNHYHPIYALRSTFGLLIQIPFFMAAYSYISKLEVIKNVSFLRIPDLGSPDALLSIGGFGINLLPIIMTLINCISGIVYTRGFPIKSKIQLYGMAAVFLVLLYNSPSALVIYWTINNIYSLVKNIYLKIKVKYKFRMLIGLFSLGCVSLAIFSIIKYSHNAKAIQLAFVCFLIALFPWIFVVFKKQFSRIAKIDRVPTSHVKSFLIFLFSCFFIWLLFGFFIPSQLVVSSPEEFSFIDNYSSPLFFIWNSALQFFGLFIFWPLFLYFLFSDVNIRKYFPLVFLALSIGMSFNAFLFPGKYGIISIDFVFNSSVQHSRREILLNLFILLIPVIIAIFLCTEKVKSKTLTFSFLCVFSLLSITFFNIYKINNSYKDLQKYYTKEEKTAEQIVPLFSMSRTGKNVVVLMLDRAISVFMPYIFEESPELKEKYSGFIYYPNTVAFNGFTRIGSPPVFGGYEYTPEEINKRTELPLIEKHNEALLMMPRIFSENGFNVSVTDPPYANYSQKGDLSIFNNYPGINAFTTDSKYTDLWIKENDLKLPETSALIKRNMFWYSLHKGLPLLFRESIYMDGNWCSPLLNHGIRLTLNGYSVLDFLPELTNITNEKTNTSLIMTNNTTHENSFLEAPEYVPVINVTNYGKSRFSKERSYHINAAAIKRLSEWFDFLKKENLYSNTRIIIIADHGAEPNFVTKTGLPINIEQFNPLLMYKDFDASGEIKTDMTFMSNADVPYLATHNLIENPVNPFTGNSVSIEPKNRPLYIGVSGSIHLGNKDETQFALNPEKDYYVSDNIFEAENWTPVSKKK